MQKSIKNYLGKIGKKGGSSTSERKKKAALKNLEIANKHRWPKKEKIAIDAKPIRE